ncbi:hypothetical protein N9A45_01955 [bacterium]|nr:hypothetical protein [bacterium]
MTTRYSQSHHSRLLEKYFGRALPIAHYRLQKYFCSIAKIFLAEHYRLRQYRLQKYFWPSHYRLHQYRLQKYFSLSHYRLQKHFRSSICDCINTDCKNISGRAFVIAHSRLL